MRLLYKVLLTRESSPTFRMAQDTADPGPTSPRKTERSHACVCRPGSRGCHGVCFRQVPWRHEGAFLR